MSHFTVMICLDGSNETLARGAAGTSAPCLACSQPREAHRKPGTRELRCPSPEPKPKVGATFTEQEIR